MNLSSCHICHCCSTQLVGKSTGNDLAPHPALPRPLHPGDPRPPFDQNLLQNQVQQETLLSVLTGWNYCVYTKISMDLSKVRYTMNLCWFTPSGSHQAITGHLIFTHKTGNR